MISLRGDSRQTVSAEHAGEKGILETLSAQEIKDQSSQMIS